MPQLTQILPSGFLFLSIGQIVLKIVAIIVASIVFKKVIRLALNRWRKKQETQSARAQTITNLIKNTSNIVIDFVLVILILSELGFNILPLLTGAGVVGLAIGMGAKDVAADLIAGFFILLENRFNVGDTIDIKGTKGQVTNISLRTTTLIDDKENTHIFPNSSISTITKLKD